MTVPFTEAEDQEREFDRQLLEQVASRRRGHFEEVGRDGIVWIAVAPSWTLRLAVACDFPTMDQRSVDEFVRAAEAAGLCASARSVRTETEASSELRALSPLAGHLSEALVLRALDLVESVDDDHARAKALTALAPTLDARWFSRAAKAAGRIARAGERATALTALAARAPDKDGRLAHDAADAALETPDPVVRARLLAVLHPLVAARSREGLASATLAAVSEIPAPEERAMALAAVSSDLDVAADLVAAVAAIEDPVTRAEVVLSSSSVLPLESRRRMLDATARWMRTNDGLAPASALLVNLVEGLAEVGDLSVAEEVALSIAEHDQRALAFGVVAAAAVAAGDRRRAKALVGQARDSLATTVLPGASIVVLAGMARLLEEAGDASTALELAHEGVRLADELPITTDVVHPFRALSAVLAELDQPAAADLASQRALAGARTIGNARERCANLLQVLPTVPESLRQPVVSEALAALGTLADPLDRIALLPALIPYLDETSRERAIDDAIKLSREAASELSFWMPDEVRAALPSLVGGLSDAFVLNIHQTVGQIGKRVLTAQKDGVAVPAPMLRWATLAARVADTSVRDLARVYDRQITDALAARDITGALEWIVTGTALANTLGDELAGIVRYAKRRIDLISRQVQDERHLADFLPREEQIDAFRALLDDTGDAWALHYLGAGGVGKTMLLRHLTTAAAEQGIATSRVDFDYLSPDYPVRRPAQLLLELMAELELYATSERDENVVRSFRDNVVQLHEETLEHPPDDPLAHLHDPGFESVLRSFCDFLRLLERPIVLFLDTCEELAKFQPDGVRLPNVAATFEVIERIRAEVDTVRVIFAGRRLLADAGRDWADADTAGEGSRGTRVERTYLRLHEVRGFSETEAHDFLTTIRKLRVGPEVEGAILRGSPDAGTVADLVWDPARDAVEIPRYNPFDLGMYAAWVAEDGSVTVDELESPGTDVYVERRIVGRVRSDHVRALLPAVALLRRFDESLLFPAFSGGAGAFQEVYETLSNEEWIDVRRDASSGATFLRVDPNLYPRLRAYYEEEPRRAHVKATAHALCPALERWLTDSSLADLSSVELVSSALGVLPDNEVSGVWHGLALRVAADARWDWARQVAAWLLGEEGSVNRRDHPARAGVGATLASALIHDPSPTDTTNEWREVLTSAARDPDEAMREWLVARARCGIVAARAAYASTTLVDDEAVEAFLSVLAGFPGLLPPDPGTAQDLTEQLAASCVAAVEALVEEAEVSGEPRLSSSAVLAWAGRLPGLGVSPALHTVAHVLAARLLEGEGRLDAAADHLDTAGRIASGMPSAPGRNWLDWAPSSLRDRIRLDVVRGRPTFGAGLPPTILSAWTTDAVLASIDGERLASAALMARMARAPVDRGELTSLYEADVYDPERRPVTAAHRAVPPLFATVAKGWLALGETGRAVDTVEARLVAATESGQDPATVRSAELTKLEVFRRMRVPDSDSSLLRRYTRSPDPGDADVALSVIVLTRGTDGLRDLDVPGPTPWRYETALQPEAVKRVSERADVQLDTAVPSLYGEHDSVDVARVLDNEEWLQVTGKPSLGATFSAFGWLAAHPGETERGLRLALRAAALGVLHGFRFDDVTSLVVDAPAQPLAGWAEEIGHRRFGELALEEGELLALRLPAAAAQLIRVARWSFTRANDPAGGLIATVQAVLLEIYAQSPDQEVAREELRGAFDEAVRAGVLREKFDFDQLVEWASQPEGIQIAEVASTQWVGWMHRLYVALVWCAAGASKRSPKPTPGAALPVELDVYTTGADAAPSPTARARAVAQLIVSLLVSLVVIALPVVLVRWGSGVAGVHLSWKASALVTAVIAVAAVAIGLWLRRVRRYVRSMFAATTPVRLTVTTDVVSDARTTPWPADTQVDVVLQTRLVETGVESMGAALVAAAKMLLALITPGDSSIFKFDAIRTSTAGWWTPEVGPYDAASAGFPESVADELKELRGALRRATLPVPLEIPPALGGLPWEAFVANVSMPIEGSRGDLAPYRRSPVARRATRAGDPPTGLHVIAARTWRRMAAEGWEAWKEPVTIFDDVTAAQMQGSPAGVLHVVGRPVSSPSGYLLQVAGGARLGDKLEESVRGIGATIRPDALPLDSSTLVVVQAEPFDAVVRVDTDREEAAKLRLFALDVCAAGAWAVVAIPSLPSLVATQSLTALATTLEGRLHEQRRWSDGWSGLGRHVGDRLEPDVMRLLGAVTRVREAIAGAPTGVRGSTSHDQDPRMYPELSHDVCVFVRTEVPYFEDTSPQGVASASAPTQDGQE